MNSLFARPVVGQARNQCSRQMLNIYRQRPRFATSSVDWKPMKSSKDINIGSGWSGKIILGFMIMMPIAAFSLGTWQVRRLKWKADLIAKAENRMTLPPLPLPKGQLDADIIDKEFDYRRVTVEGTFEHDQEMLIGPRIHDGRNGYIMVTPLVRENGTKVLIVRGWIDEAHKDKKSRPYSMVKGPQKITALLRRKPQKSSFTAEGNPLQGMYHFLDIDQMAAYTGSQPVYIQQLIDESQDSGLLESQKIIRGIPIAATGKVEFHNSHFQYILTWYGLCALTSFMLFYLVKSKRESQVKGVAKRIAHEKRGEW